MVTRSLVDFGNEWDLRNVREHDTVDRGREMEGVLMGGIWASVVSNDSDRVSIPNVL